MAKNLIGYPDAMVNVRTFGFLDDFDWYVTAHRWTTVATDSGTVSVADGKNGVLALVASDGTVADNDESYVKSTAELFLVAANKPIVGQALVQFTEANTDDANVAFGFQNAVGANSILDD